MDFARADVCGVCVCKYRRPLLSVCLLSAAEIHPNSLCHLELVYSGDFKDGKFHGQGEKKHVCNRAGASRDLNLNMYSCALV